MHDLTMFGTYRILDAGVGTNGKKVQIGKIGYTAEACL